MIEDLELESSPVRVAIREGFTDEASVAAVVLEQHDLEGVLHLGTVMPTILRG
jgi:hypothetical protein